MACSLAEPTANVEASKLCGSAEALDASTAAELDGVCCSGRAAAAAGAGS